MSLKWFRGLRGKLLFTSFLPLIGFGTIASVSLYGLNGINSSLQTSYTTVIPSIHSLGQMNTALNAIGRWSWNSYANIEDQVTRKKAVEKIKDATEDFKKYQKIYESNESSPKEKEMYKVVEQNWPKALEHVSHILQLYDQNTPEANAEAKGILVTEYKSLSVPMEKNMTEIIEMYESQVTQNEIDARALYSRSSSLILFISIGATLAIFAFMMIISVHLAGSVGLIAEKLADSSLKVSSSSHQLSSAGQQLSSSSTEAAASLEETVSSLEELSSMVKLNADNAKEAAALSQTSRQSAEEGEHEIRTLIESMKEISQSSKKIEEIINVIDDIAFQTNLLALNAAVEAARAGEQGKGFAVVAEAVRSLAQRSAAAAKDITGLIQDSVAKTEKGTKVADQSGSVLKNIVISVKKVSDLNTEISSASQEQSTGITQISQAMTQLDRATQSNASSAEEVAASAESMSGQSVYLKDYVAQLSLIVDGAPMAEQEHHRPAQTQVASNVAYINAHDQKLRSPKLKGPKRKFQDHAEDILPLGDEPTNRVGTTNGF